MNQTILQHEVTMEQSVSTNTAETDESIATEQNKITVTVVPADGFIAINGEFISFKYDYPKNLRALQWNGTSGHTEWYDKPNKLLSIKDYYKQVEPFVTLWQNEKERLKKKASDEEAARIAYYNSEECRFERLREERNTRIEATDYLVMSDYPISEKDLDVIKQYRQALRDLPAQEGAPWDGGGEETPWPAEPVTTFKL